MGNAARKEKKKEKARQQTIIEEKQRKGKHKIMFFIGDSKSGKSKIIEQILSINRSNQLANTKQINFQYKLGKSFIINETVYGENINHSSKSYNHLDIVNRNLNVPKHQPKGGGLLGYDPDEDLPKYEMNFEQIVQDTNWMKQEIVVFGYIHEIFGYTTPIDIIQTINKYHQGLSYIDVHIFCDQQLKVTFELWELSVFDQDIWKEIFNYSSAIVFVSDVSGHDLNVKSNGVLRDDEILFQSACKVLDELHSQPQMILFLNKFDLFAQKMKNEIGMGNNDGESGVGASENDSDAAARDVIESISDTYSSLMQKIDKGATLYRFATNACDKNDIKKVFWDCKNIVIRANLKMS